MTPFLRLAPIVERLEQTCRPILREIGTAADLAAAAQAMSPASPGAYVVPLGSEVAESREGSGPLRQTFQPDFAVLLRLNLAGLRGSAGLKAFEEPAEAIFAALFGWVHPDAELKCESAGAGLEEFLPDLGVILFRLDFRTQVRLMETLP